MAGPLLPADEARRPLRPEKEAAGLSSNFSKIVPFFA
jgi:hypothetical protein